LQRDSSLDKLHTDKNLDDLSNQKEYSNGKPQSFNSEEFHSAHSKHSDAVKLSDADEPREAKEGQQIPASAAADAKLVGAQANHPKPASVAFQGKMTMTQS
jgi:hypothetical protein